MDLLKLRLPFKNRYWLDVLAILSLGITLPFFFYKLGQSSLVSWDEAWYGEIARNILRSGELIKLTHNGSFYIDHPPAGFWFIALSMKIFGENEFGVRAAAAIIGFLGLVVLYFLGRELFNRRVGLMAAFGLSSATWYLYRARSGNLDVTLTVFFLLTLLLALKSTKKSRYFIPFTFSFLLLFLTKTIVPLTIIPALIVIFWWLDRKSWRYLIISISVIIILIWKWVSIQLNYTPIFAVKYFGIGLPGANVKTDYIANLKLTKIYLHNGIGQWFWPGVGSLFVSQILFNKNFLILFVFFISFFTPFLFSPKGHIWHLVPLHPILILGFFGFIDEFIVRAVTLIQRIIDSRYLVRINAGVVSFIFLAIIGGFITYSQLRAHWYQFIDIDAYISDEQILSEEASRYNERFYIDGDFLPVAAYYSRKVTKQIHNEEIRDIFVRSEGFVLITQQWRLDQNKIDSSKYRILKSNRDKILLQKTSE